MSVEEKQALAGLCRIEIKRWRAASESNPNMSYMVELMEVALAALTAQPVKLPKIKHPAQFDYADEVITIFKAHNIKVQE